jgi:hypothetical protein
VTEALAAGGRSIIVGPAAVLLTEYAPTTVINTSLTSRVWLASSSSVGPGTAVPLEPGTAYDWLTGGQLWAILDPAAPDPNATVIITGSGTAWTPSPVAIGAAVATELAESGVPTKLRTAYLGSWVINPGVTLTLLPISGLDFADYGSVFVYAIQTGGASNVPLAPLTYQWKLALTGNLIGREDLLAFNTEPTAFVPGMMIPVLGDLLVVTNPSAAPVTFVAIGYSRQIYTMPVGNGFASAGWFAQTGAITTSGDHPFIDQVGSMPQGLVQVHLSVAYASAETPTDGTLHLLINGLPNFSMSISDQTQWKQYFPQVWVQDFQTAFPAVAAQLVFHLSATPSPTLSNVSLYAIPAYI